MSFDLTLVVLVAALGIDAIVGDPPALWRRVPHPVVLFGTAISAADRALNRPAAAAATRRWLGVAAIAGLLLVAAGIGALATDIALALPGGPFFLAALASVMIAWRSLEDHVRAVADGLLLEGLAGGRRAVAHIVGRDPELLDESGVAGAAIESAAENFSDGLVAPAFYFALFGLPGLFAYKMLNTADSMIGHRSERHEAFGWAAARLDDLANLVPARLSAALILLAARPSLAELRARAAIVRADAPRHRSPNAGWPETATAVSLNLSLGGPRRYAGEGVVDGARLNAAGRSTLAVPDIEASLALLGSAAVLHAVLYAVLLALVAG